MGERVTARLGRLAVVALAVLGVVLSWQGVDARAAAEPPGLTRVASAPNGGDLQPEEVPAAGLEWRSPGIVRRPSPRLAQVGAVRFHAGVGLSLAAAALAVLCLAGLSRAPWPSRVVSLLGVFGAGGAALHWMLFAGPKAGSAAAAAQVLSGDIPVFGLCLLLGLAFDARAAGPRTSASN